jgi:replicative DNA helicase
MRALEQITERHVPYNLDVEMGLLGSVLMNNDGYRRVADIVSEEDFFEPLHKRVWRLASSMIEEGMPASPITLRTYLGDKEIAPGVTAPQYLARLAAETTGGASAADYARIVRDLSLRRQIIGIADDVMTTAYDAPVETTADAIVGDFESAMMKLRQARGEAGDFVDFGNVSARAIGMAESAYKREGRIVGVSTGLPNLDTALGGLQASDLIVLAGRPGMGKTALATNIAFDVAKTLQARRRMGERTGVVGFSSLEMSGEQLAQRILSEQSGVPFWKIRRGIASELDMEAYIQAQRELREIPLKIDPTGGLSVGSLRIRARALKKRLGLELLVIDYLQLLTGSGKRENKRVDEVTEITMGLKALAKELNVPVLALAQLSRRVEERDDKRPMLSDLRESGSIEQDADVVMFVFREEYYLRKQKPRDGTEAHLRWERDLRAVQGVAQVIIGKNRHGPEGTVTLGFDANTTRFLDEPPPREEGPAVEDQTGRPKKLSLPREATVAYGILRGLSIGDAVDNTGLAGVPYKVRPVPYALWREKCAQQLLDPGFDEKAAVSLMKKVVPALIAAEVVGRGGTKDQPFAWLVDPAR